MSVKESRQKKKIYYGWIIVIAGFFIWTTAFGVQYSFGVFFKPLQEAFGWSRATTSWAMSIHLVVVGLAMVPTGWAIDRLNPRAIFSVSAILIGSSLVLCSFISSPWQLYLLYGLPLGVGVSICGPPIMVMVTRWFIEKRGVALGVTSAGVGVGILAGAPLSNLLITSYGWRYAFIILGSICCFVILVCAYFIKRTPAILPVKRTAVEAKPQDVKLPSKTSPSRSATFGQAIKTRPLFLIMGAQSTVAFSVRMVTVHIAPYVTDIGISQSTAALAIGAIGAFSVLGRLIMGTLQDRMGARAAMMVCVVIQLASMLSLPFIRNDMAFFVFASAFGFAYGGDVPQIPAMAAQLYGLTSIGTILGLIMTGGNLAGAAGPIIAGYFFDVTGQYTVIFLAAAGLLVAGIFSLYKVKLPGNHAG